MEIELPENFISVMKDFTSDLKKTFPEFSHIWWIYGEDTTEDGWKDLFSYCLKIYPERFFDILYQNEDMFKSENESNVDFFPRVDFKKIYFGEGVSSQTQQTIWKYLQLILFMVIQNVKDKNEFGNTMNLFEGIDEKELQEKMVDAMGGLEDFFKNIEKNGNDTDEENTDEDSFKKAMEQGENMMDEMFQKFQSQTSDEPPHADISGNPQSNDMPDPENLYSHLKGLFGGKLGHLAQELMDELMEDMQETLGINPEELNENSNPMDGLKKLMRKPDKLMALVNKIKTKFEAKMNSGDLSQDDIMKEMGEMFSKMKEMGGNSKQMNEMFQNMASQMGGSMGKNMKVDMNKLNRMMKGQEVKDRLRAKVAKKNNENYILEQSSTSDNYVYRPLGAEAAEKSVLTDEAIDKIAADIGDIGVPTPKTKNTKNNKKKNKKKK
jgi:hypothetical protein